MKFLKIRRLWRINPRSRIKESAKVYSRKKKKEEDRKIVRQDDPSL
jgi:hypothetical protein